MGQRMYLTAAIVYSRLREHGHWVRQHLRDDNPVLHPLVDVLAWETRFAQKIRRHRGGALRQGPRDGLLAMARVDTYDELCRLASQRARWRRIVEEEAMREQLAVATATSERRRREPRGWTEKDHGSLLRLAEANARARFNDSDK